MMNYLESFLAEKRRPEKTQAPTDKTDKTGSVSSVSQSLSHSRASFPSAEKAQTLGLARADGYMPLPLPGAPAYSILETCRRHGIALSLDEDGCLRIGRADRSGEGPALWPSLLMAIEAHLEPVAALVAAGWHVRADFPKDPAA